ncbi:hypothetical protein L1987_53827 [Smallanthus sonchifolius]|uniref:Uncharacterized protein n=1 Tax=Smallanthus sonchifolius TaxID=185202 RepID=A0ACB9EXL4_9ASTR|nr:hypothetical protein L1987_53827 [Smallanthus sonchifolius]
MAYQMRLHGGRNTLSEPLLVHEEKTSQLAEEPSFLSKLVFSWVNPLLAKGYKKPLVLEDIPSLESIDQAEVAHEKFTKAWDSLRMEQTLNNANMVLKTLAKVYFQEIVLSGVCVFLRTIAVVASPLLLYAFVNYTNREIKDLHQGCLLIGCLIVVKVTESLSHRHFFFTARRTGMRMRSALMVKVYEKQLKLSNLGKKRHSAGEVVNYIAVDAYRMVEFPMWFHVCWSSFIQLCLAIGVLFSIVGLGVLPGLVPLIICALLNLPYAKAIKKCQLEFMVAQDKRLRSTSEILNNMKVIKLQSWEEKFKQIVESCREVEFRWLSEVQFKKVYATILYWMSPTLVSSVILFGCVFLGSAPLDSATIFTILATLRTMSEPVRFLPEAISALIQVNVSFDRINSFLVDDELNDDLVKRDQEMEKSDSSIRIKDGNFAWDPESPVATLRDVNLEVKCGQKVAVCGSVGSGKSSVLYAILGEISKTSGNDCVMTCLESKTVILVTHQVEFLSSVDNILVMQDGQVTQSGSYEDLLMAGTAFEQLVNAHKDAITSLDTSPSEDKRELHNTDNKSWLNKKNSDAKILTKGLGVQLTEEEEKETGNVGWKTFLDYVVISEGLWFLSLFVITNVGFLALQAAASYWLAFGIQVPEITTVMLICVYTLFSTTSIVFVYLRSLFATLMGLKASKSFFQKFTDSVFAAPMVFFDSTPVGRILTRVSSDLSVIDFDIPFSVVFAISAGIELLATIGIMASVTWQVLIVAIFAIVASKYVQGYYQPTARELMRINGTTKAPVMNYASETSLGVATIRAFKMQDRFFKEYLKLVDRDASTSIFSNATLEWLILRTEAFSNLTLITAGFLLVYTPKGSVSPVERIKQFMHIPPEKPAIVENNRPPSSWPSKGKIQFEDLKLRYRPNTPLVLKGITCTFKEGTRVGIVGRTGSGKTTLITALFRLVEPDSGRILIDGLNICPIGLKDLRMKLSVIPQEPTLFRGSIRTNMDPLGLHSDDEIWKALEKCQLKNIISRLPNLLDSSVSDEGENWSAGQRQLFCLGRVLLRRNKILVLDEATASIDSATDVILQRIIREEFSSCTVITVAHRVPTVIDSDKVMVLSFGEMVEYDEPSKLMETDSFFSKLVAEYWTSCRKNSGQKLDDFQ